MPTELIKCSNAVRLDTHMGSGNDAPGGMVESMSAGFLAAETMVWSAGGQRKPIPLTGRGEYQKPLLQSRGKLQLLGFSEC